jgi:hypothetical protein
MTILELTERMKELNLQLMEKNRDGAGVAANRIIQQIDALKVSHFFPEQIFYCILFSPRCLAYLQMNGTKNYVLHTIRTVIKVPM